MCVWKVGSHMRRGIPQLNKKQGTALVLSGGATKAFYFHIGVLKALGMEDISSIVGTSAGAVVGALVATGTRVDTLEAALRQKQVYIDHLDSIIKSIDSGLLFRLKPQYLAKQSAYTGVEALRFMLSLPVLWRQDVVAEALDRLVLSQRHVPGFFSADSLEALFQNLLPSNSFLDTDIDLYVTAACLDTHERAVFNAVYAFDDGASEFINDVPIHKAVRASMSIPGMFEPVKIKGKYYIDGEIKRSLSLDVGLALADRVVVSHTYQPLLRENGTSIAQMGWLSIFKQSIHLILRERIMIWRDIYEHQYPEKEVLWIEPDPEDMEFFLAPEFSFRPEVQKLIIERGEIAATKALEAAAAKGG